MVDNGQAKHARQNYAEIIELHDPVTIPAGYKGLITDLTRRHARRTPIELVSAKGERGVQTTTLEPGTYYLNPYVQEVRLVDCRSQRYNLNDIGFPTKDGFWVSLEAIIEFRVKPEEAATTYILFSEEREGKTLAEEVITKVILPNARAYTRLRGSNHSGKEFITGDTRVTFQEDFQKTMKSTCDKQGIEIIQALITTIKPPEKIADPVRRRQIALQQEDQYKKEIEQQTAETEIGRAKGHGSAEEGAGRRFAGSGRRDHRGQEEAGSGADRRQQTSGGRRTEAAGRQGSGGGDHGQRQGRRRRDQFRQSGGSGGLAEIDRRLQRQRQRVRPLDAATRNWPRPSAA